MHVNVLVNNGDKYGGKYVALKSFDEKDAVSSGKNPVEVYNKAKKKGIEDPVIFYVPKKNSLHVY